MNRIIIVPDVHGRPFWKKILDRKKSDDKIIFLGDYSDPYKSEHLYFNNAINELKDIIKFAKENENVTLLYGNHDIYAFPGLNKLSNRYDFKNHKQYEEVYLENKSLFSFAYQIDNILFTHAGVSSKWIENENADINESNITEYINKKAKLESLFNVGYERGGYGYGGPVWADASEVFAYPAFSENIIQIFGHTQLGNTGEFLNKNNLYCCDSREVFVYENNILKIF